MGNWAIALAGVRRAERDVGKLSQGLALAAGVALGTIGYVGERGKCDTKKEISGLAARNSVVTTRLTDLTSTAPVGRSYEGTATSGPPPRATNPPYSPTWGAISGLRPPRSSCTVATTTPVRP